MNPIQIGFVNIFGGKSVSDFWFSERFEPKVFISIEQISKFNQFCFSLFIVLAQARDERDFGLETETETRVVSVSVSSFETEASKSQSQSHFLRPKGQSLSISLKIWDWFLKSQSQSQILRLESKSLGLSLKMHRMVSLITEFLDQ